MKFLNFKFILVLLLNFFFVYGFVQKGFLNSGGIFVTSNYNNYLFFVLEFALNLFIFNILVILVLSLIRYLLEFLEVDNFKKNLMTSILYVFALLGGIFYLYNSIPETNKNIVLNKNLLMNKFNIVADNFSFKSYLNNSGLFKVFKSENNLGGFKINGKYTKFKNINSKIGTFDLFVKNLNIENKIIYKANSTGNFYKNNFSFKADNVKFVISEENLDANLISMLYIYTKYIPLNFSGNGNLNYLQNVDAFLISNFMLKNKFFNITSGKILIKNINYICLLEGNIILHFNKKNLSKLYNLYENFYQNFGEKVNTNILNIEKKEKLSYEDFLKYIYTYIDELNKRKYITVDINELKNNFSILLSGQKIRFDVKIRLK